MERRTNYHYEDCSILARPKKSRSALSGFNYLKKNPALIKKKARHLLQKRWLIVNSH